MFEPGERLQHPDITRLMRDGYPDAEAVYICDRCCLGIYPGEEYYESDIFEGVLCPSCVRRMTGGELMDWFDLPSRTA